MQENNNENKKTLNENDANDVMQNSENTETNDTEETDVTPVSEENVSESELTEITSLMFPIQSVKKKRSIITVLTMRKTILQFLPKKMTKHLRLSKTTMQTTIQKQILKKNREKPNLLKKSKQD